MLNLKQTLGVVFAALLTTTAGHSGAISINGVCQFGNCTSPDVLRFGQNANTPFDFTYTFLNSDEYHLFGIVNWANAGETVSFTATVVYLGNLTNTASSTDVLTLDFLQNYDEGGLTSSTFYENGGEFFWGPIASTSSVTEQLSYSGQSLPLMGPFTPAGPNSASISNITLSGLGDPLLGQFQIAFTFGAGSDVGATIDGIPNNTTPEPATFLYAGTGLAILALRFRLARKNLGA